MSFPFYSVKCSSVRDDLERVQVGRQDDFYNKERSSEFEPRSDSGKVVERRFDRIWLQFRRPEGKRVMQ